MTTFRGYQLAIEQFEQMGAATKDEAQRIFCAQSAQFFKNKLAELTIEEASKTFKTSLKNKIKIAYRLLLAKLSLAR